eukprot:TRINITY_DN721_c0_g3_i3.p1 TRINITY_DN721_c0_g3~~TRINITY_DN721_c0_g3_i3.p1  ORF type:complete len:328 (+),score=113.23 TRINITY_DN721_c0_g3_i3:76-1059(+)
MCIRDRYYEKEMKALGTKCDEMAKALMQLQGERDEYRDKLEECELVLRSKCEELEYLNKRQTDLRMNYTELDEQYKSLRLESATMQPLARETEELRMKRRELEIELSRVKSEHEVSRALLEKQTSELNEIKGELRVLRERNIQSTDTERRLSEANVKIQQLQDKKSKHKGELAEAHTKITELTRENETLKREVEDLRSCNESSVGLIQKELSQIQQDIEILREENQFLKRENMELAMAEEKVRVERDRLEKARNRYKNEALVSKYEKERLREEYAEKENALKTRLTTELDKATKDRNQKESIETKARVLTDIQSLINDHRRRLNKQN